MLNDHNNFDNQHHWLTIEDSDDVVSKIAMTSNDVLDVFGAAFSRRKSFKKL
jgi:hypothetical protein